MLHCGMPCSNSDYRFGASGAYCFETLRLLKSGDMNHYGNQYYIYIDESSLHSLLHIIVLTAHIKYGFHRDLMFKVK